MDNLRGQPTVDEFILQLEKVWEKNPDITFTRLLGCAYASLNLIGDELGNAIFMGSVTDEQFLWGLHYWMWMARGEVPSSCPYCDVEWNEHEPPKRNF